jgi:hypothetical protein
VEGGYDEAARRGKLDQLSCLCAGGCEGLVDDDVFSSFERLLCQREMGLVGCADDDQLDGWVGERFFDRAEDAGGGVGFCGLAAAALHNSFELEAWNRADERGMEDTPRKAKADDGNSDI